MSVGAAAEVEAAASPAGVLTRRLAGPRALLPSTRIAGPASSRRLP